MAKEMHQHQMLRGSQRAANAAAAQELLEAGGNGGERLVHGRGGRGGRGRGGRGGRGDAAPAPVAAVDVSESASPAPTLPPTPPPTAEELEALEAKRRERKEKKKLRRQSEKMEAREGGGAVVPAEPSESALTGVRTCGAPSDFVTLCKLGQGGMLIRGSKRWPRHPPRS